MSLIKRNQDLFGGLLENFWNDSAFIRPEFKEFTIPAVNIKNNTDAFEIEVAAPGLNKEDFDIEVKDDVLTLKVDKSSETSEQNDNFTRKEFNYFNFQRSFNLPNNQIDAEKVQANYKDGILCIKLPKLVEQKEAVKKITVE